MILTQLVILQFFNGATGVANTASTTGLPVLTCLHFFNGFTEAPEVIAGYKPWRQMIKRMGRGMG